VIYSYALSNLLLPDVFWSPRLLAYLFVALATALLGYIARLEFGRGFALPTMWLMTPMVLLPGIEQFPASVEMFMLFPLLATVAIYCHGRQQEHKSQPWHWFAAAFFAVTALLYKYTALPVLAFTFAAWFIEIQQKAVNKGFILRCLAFGLAGAVTAAALEVG
jgi:4-amino-4-deoxy-L-arabinose transferase-like glycosyltransferase